MIKYHQLGENLRGYPSLLALAILLERRLNAPTTLERNSAKEVLEDLVKLSEKARCAVVKTG